jgi:hypothetical protein
MHHDDHDELTEEELMDLFAEGLISGDWKDDEHHDEDHHEEEVCDEWCQWENSDWNNYDEDWDEDTKAQYWFEKSAITGCDTELICEFYECEEDEQAEFDSHCWREECYSDCEQYVCGLWH